MKTHLLRADNSGSGFYRVDEPARALQELGYDVTVADSMAADSRRDHLGQEDVQRVHVECDVLVLQRPLRQSINQVALAAKRQGITVVVDIDDDFLTVSPGNMAYRAIDPRLHPLHNVEWLKRTLEVADGATVSTTALMKYHPNSVVVRNRIPQRVLDYRSAESSLRTLGWTGTVATHPDDLQVASAGVRAVMPSVSPSLAIVGQSRGVAQLMQLEPGHVTETGWITDVEAYWKAIADNIGVGIVPLDLTDFNHAKSFLKGLEYAALGIPFVASPTREYQVFEAYGAGRLATSPGGWSKHLRSLLTDDRRYETSRARGIETVERDWLLEPHAEEWQKAWEAIHASRSL